VTTRKLRIALRRATDEGLPLEDRRTAWTYLHRKARENGISLATLRSAHALPADMSLDERTIEAGRLARRAAEALGADPVALGFRSAGAA
jgi:hypothetical protein